MLAKACDNDTIQVIAAQFQATLKEMAILKWAESNLLQPGGPKLSKNTKTKKEQLANYSGMTVKQVTDRFTNYRSRLWKKSLEKLLAAGDAKTIAPYETLS